jgi:hypothetical protein
MKSTKSIITNTKMEIIKACLKIVRISITFPPFSLKAGKGRLLTHPAIIVRASALGTV